jgi:hypothetical protein
MSRILNKIKLSQRLELCFIIKRILTICKFVNKILKFRSPFGLSRATELHWVYTKTSQVFEIVSDIALLYQLAVYFFYCCPALNL